MLNLAMMFFTLFNIIIIIATFFLVANQRLALSRVDIQPDVGQSTLVPGKRMRLKCEIAENNQTAFAWYIRSYSKERFLESSRTDGIEIDNGILDLVKPTADQEGDYICRALRDADAKSEISPQEYALFQVRSKPQIEDLSLESSYTGKSITVVEGERLELKCTVGRREYPVQVSWLESIQPVNDQKTLLLPINQIVEGPVSRAENKVALNVTSGLIVKTIDSYTKKLIIESVNFTHRNYYACLVKNEIGAISQKLVLVRVRSRYAILWPTIGIVSLLTILFIVIYVCETRRVYREIRETVNSNLEVVTKQLINLQESVHKATSLATQLNARHLLRNRLQPPPPPRSYYVKPPTPNK